MNKDSLGDRMKENYENRYRFSLTRRTPVIIRIDGKAFHTYTKGFDKPYDKILSETMWETAEYLCKNIMGCRLAYTQSDEISLLLTDYRKLTSQAWFDNNLQKICSVSASMATMAFNRAFTIKIARLLRAASIDGNAGAKEAMDKYMRYSNVMGEAMFDARAFNIPESEVCNYFIWRQQDATRNSIESLGRCYFTNKELHKVNCNGIQDKLMIEKGINWNDCPVFFKRGVCIRKKADRAGDEPQKTTCWRRDMDIPVFIQDRGYIEELLKPEEE